MDTTARHFEALQAAAERITREVVAVHAADVDSQSRFPTEAVQAFQRAGLMSAPVPVSHGGSGLSMREMGAIVSTIASACGSSAMVLAMHYIQVACVARHVGGSVLFDGFLREISDQQLLLGSITSEVGTFGATRTSICAVEIDGDELVLHKDATTGSYCAHADVLLVTCRRAPDAAQSDQALVMLRRGQYTLEQTTTWDTMGMRGTCSPGFKLSSRAPAGQVIPVPYADISALSMVPYSHILWSSLWWGIAAGAHAKAAQFVRGQARKTPGTTPPTALRLAELSVQLQAMKNNWQMLATEYDEAVASGRDATVFTSMGWALKMNALKTACSEMAPQIVHGALQIVGILGYKNDSPFTMGRAYRDALSGALMISNDRIAATSASMLLVYKDQ